MVETSSDQSKAFLYAVGVHVFAAVIMFAGMIFSTTPKTVIPKGTIEAVWVDMSVGRPLPKPKPKPKPEAPKPTPPKPVERAKPEPAPPPPPPDATPDEVTDNVPLPPPVPDQEALNFERQREELRKQQEEARRQQELEEQRIQQLADIREQRAEAQAEREREEQLLADVQEQRADPPLDEPEPEGAERPGQDVEDDLLSQYVGLIQEAVTQNWRRPANTPPGIRCKLLVRQIPGGEVIGVQVSAPCNADPLIQESIKEAVERASPLPYDGFDSVFQSSLIFNFEYDG